MQVTTKVRPIISIVTLVVALVGTVFSINREVERRVEGVRGLNGLTCEGKADWAQCLD